MESPLVSIITPTHNSSKYIEDSISSVLKQIYTKWELIIIDDASDDITVDIIKSYIHGDGRIQLIQLKSWQGPAEARNAGIRAAKGRFIAFLDSDDQWVEDKLSTQIPFMLKNKVALSYGWYRRVNEEGKELHLANTPKLHFNYKKLLLNNGIGCLTAVYDTEITGKVEMPNILRRQDYGLWLKILKKGYIAQGVPKILGIYRVRKNSASSNKLKLIKYQWQLYNKVEKLNFFLSCFYLTLWAFRGVKNKLLKKL